MNYIASLPDELTLWFRDTPPIFVTHGVPGSPWDGIARYTSEKRLVELGRMIKPDFLIVGHTHLQLDRTIHFDDRSLRIFNPGAVGIPLDGQPMANYMILDSSEAGWTPTFRRVRYDVEKMLQAFRQVDYVEHTGAVGRMFIEEIRLARPIVAPYLRWKSQYYPDQMETMTMAEEFLRLPPEKIWSLLPSNYQINPQFPIQFGTW